MGAGGGSGSESSDDAGCGCVVPARELPVRMSALALLSLVVAGASLSRRRSKR